MTATDYTPRGRPFTGPKMLATVLTFFAVIIAANLTMAWFAVTGFRGVVVESGYVASQDFNAAAARLAEQTARGWRLDLTADAGHPVLRLTDAGGRRWPSLPSLPSPNARATSAWTGCCT